ncbi:hypothetical protein Poli38472_006767 [Pythium oligandrum]|uniref:Uncharacterized protein n=1 Tax=Pythium oligandrum TaxID=41045 RepID=A0A8K1C651_PYTOL|nr:hypothetical protein Poli38472_006767 [Pythium oligandrum]|eukprot:TMW56757.1 hypothetical protein Poli38472_006767 [Pythium oligandrum]
MKSVSPPSGSVTVSSSESDARVDDSPTQDAVVTTGARQPAKGSPTTKQRQWERQSRLRRKENMEMMRKQVKTLECALANIMFVRDQTEGWEEIDDEESVLMRKFLRMTSEMSGDIHILESERDRLQRKLLEYAHFVSSVRLTKRSIDADDWEMRTARWRAVTHAALTPWTKRQCQEVAEDALRQIQAYGLRDDLVTSGLSFNGWRDRRRLEEQSCTMQFSFYKNHSEQDFENLVNCYWQMHHNGEDYGHMVLGSHVKLYYEVVQEVSPDFFIVRSAQQYPGVPVTIHLLALLFRVKTEDQYLFCVKSIPADKLEVATAEDDAAWTSTFHWTASDVTKRGSNGECAGYQLSINGFLTSPNLQFLHRWMIEALVSVVRSESMILGQKLLLAE